MAGHLLAAGHELFIRDLEPAPKEFIDCGATECGTCCEVADQAKVVTIMVPDTPDVAGLLFGIDGVSEGLTAGTTVVDMSTISPIETKVFAERINALGCDYLDAPVSGGKVGRQKCGPDDHGRPVGVGLRGGQTALRADGGPPGRVRDLR
jgi:2-hydroxy-3-oxopropionate reductase